MPFNPFLLPMPGLMPEILAETCEETRAELQLRVPVDLEHFAGHFPGLPILPGIVQMDWAVRLARRYFSGLDRSIGVDNLKFQSIVRPGALLDLMLTHDSVRHRLEFAYRENGRLCSSGTLRFEVMP